MAYLYSKFTSFFQEKTGSASSVKVGVNGGMANGKPSFFSKRNTDQIPVVEITDSPSSRRIKKAASVGSVSGLSEELCSPDDTRPASAGGGGKMGEDETDLSLSPTQSLNTESIVSPSRKSNEALKKVCNVFSCFG